MVWVDARRGYGNRHSRDIFVSGLWDLRVSRICGGEKV